MTDLAALLLKTPMQFVSLDRLADGRWEATFRGANRNVMRQVTASDPVSALTAVLSAPPAPKPKSVSDLL